MDLSLCSCKGLPTSIILEEMEELVRASGDGKGVKELGYQALLSEFTHHNLAPLPPPVVPAAAEAVLCTTIQQQT